MNSFRLGLITWNVGAAPAGITPGAGSLLTVAQNCDIIVVGLQEVSVASRGWKKELRKALGRGWEYIGGENYAGLRLKAFARVKNGRSIVPFAAPGTRVGVGFVDRWPNKGAVAINIRFSNSCRVVFVVAHLAANEERLQSREDDWHAILRRLDRDEFLRAPDGALGIPLFHRYEHVFVLGDLNYRIVAPGDTHEQKLAWVHQRVAKKDWCRLVSADQLGKERMNSKVFADFEEGHIQFAPTFKIDPKTGQYSNLRVPSYCDRIMWHSLPARTRLVRCLQYQPLTAFKQSDHIPVYGEFQLDVPVVLPPTKSLSWKGESVCVVLEFLLVRFVKGVSSLVRRKSIDETPRSVRRIKEPQSLKIVSNSGLTFSHERRATGLIEHIPDEYDEITDALMKCNLPDDDSEDGEFDDVDFEDEEDDSSCSSSSDEDENFPCNQIDAERYHARKIAEIPRDSEDYAAFDLQMNPTRIGSSSTEPNVSAEMYSQTLTPMSSSSTFGETPSNTPTSVKQIQKVAGPSGSLPDPLERTPSERGVSPGLNAHANTGPRKRDSISKQVVEPRHSSISHRRRKGSRLRQMRMEVHGKGLFLKKGKAYWVSLPKRRNGVRERLGEALPVIPLARLSSLKDLEYRHVLLEFAKNKSRFGTSGAFPLRELLPYVGQPYAFEMSLTKYGMPVATVEACVQLTAHSRLWTDARGKVVRDFNGRSAKEYDGPLEIREKTRARTKPDCDRWR